jgi:hypothetical protein
MMFGGESRRSERVTDSYVSLLRKTDAPNTIYNPLISIVGSKTL